MSNLVNVIRRLEKELQKPIATETYNVGEGIGKQCTVVLSEPSVILTRGQAKEALFLLKKLDATQKAHWEQKWVCSRCGGSCTMPDECNFCPHCGAIMEKGESDD